MADRNGEKLVFPVTHEGVIVGYATSEDDRNINIKITADSKHLLREWREMHICGFAEGLSIRPGYIPATPTTMKESM